jgi:DNA-binding Lrp family transcriptional regulator
MKSVSGSRRRKPGAFLPDALDLRILESLVEDGAMQYKEIAKRAGVDKRTVAKRVEAMKARGALKITADIDWAQVGVGAYAFVGTQTGLGEKDAASLYAYIKEEPRVIEAYSTVGSDEYFLVVVDEDLQSLREDVLRKLEPLTADLSTAIVSTRIKARNHAKFLRFLSDRKNLQK